MFEIANGSSVATPQRSCKIRFFSCVLHASNTKVRFSLADLSVEVAVFRNDPSRRILVRFANVKGSALEYYTCMVKYMNLCMNYGCRT